GMKILHVVGARPNFMKVAPIIDAFDAYAGSPEAEVEVRQVLVHTGQHYDRAMSELFFEQLGMPKPDINLSIGSGPHGWQTGRIMEAFEPVLLEQRPDLVLVVGDVNSTLACAIDAKKLGIPVAHLEAGLRSGDRTMPEEINRLATDAISDLLLAPSDDAVENLRNEGTADSRIEMVGNIMLDAYEMLAATISAAEVPASMELNSPYGVISLHWPANVDDPERLRAFVELLLNVSVRVPLVFPMHPRTTNAAQRTGLYNLLARSGQIRIVDPMSYVDFMS